MDELTARTQRMAESILENEALTDNLDDEGGQALLDWGVALAKQVAQATAGLDEAAAETAMADKLAATRRLLRAVNKRFDPTLLADLKTNSQATTAANTSLLNQVVEQAAIIRTPNFTQPTPAQQASFVEQALPPLDSAPALIASLRSFIEQPPVSAPVAAPPDQDLPADQSAPTTASSVATPTPAQTVAMDNVVSIPPQPPITVDKPAASPASPALIAQPAAVAENSTPEQAIARQGLAWATRLVSNFRRFLQRSANPS